MDTLNIQPKLSMAKCRRNVENFLDACRKMGVPEVNIYLFLMPNKLDLFLKGHLFVQVLLY